MARGTARPTPRGPAESSPGPRRNLGKGRALEHRLRRAVRRRVRSGRHPRRRRPAPAGGDSEAPRRRGVRGRISVLGTRAAPLRGDEPRQAGVQRHVVVARSRRSRGPTSPTARPGFRLYTRRLIEATGFPEPRFEAESAVLVRAARHGFRIVGVPVRLDEADGRATSHYRPVVDSLRIAGAVVRRGFEPFRERRGGAGHGRQPRHRTGDRAQLCVCRGGRVAFTYRERRRPGPGSRPSLGGVGAAVALDLPDRPRAGHVVARSRSARTDRRPGEQRGYPPRRLARGNGRRRLGRGDRREPGRGLPLLPRRAPRMIARRAGRIVNVSSLTAVHGVAGQAAYGAAKAGPDRADELARARGGAAANPCQRCRPGARGDRDGGGHAAGEARGAARHRGLPAGTTPRTSPP